MSKRLKRAVIIVFVVVPLSVVTVAVGIMFGYRVILETTRLEPLEQVIRDACNGSIDSSDASRYEWECYRHCDNLEWLPDLPPAEYVSCLDPLLNGGACCKATFGNGIAAEIHPYPLKNGRYRIVFFAYPHCRNPEYDPTAERGSPERRQTIRCDERWRSSGGVLTGRDPAVLPECDQ